MFDHIKKLHQKEIENIYSHLTNPWCIFKEVKKLKTAYCYPGYVTNDKINRITRSIEELQLSTYNSMLNGYTFMTFSSDTYPNVKKCRILHFNYSQHMNNLFSSFPMIHTLEIDLIGSAIPHLIKILKIIEPTIENLSITIDQFNFSNIAAPVSHELGELLSAYKPNGLKSMYLLLQTPQYVYRSLRNQCGSLTNLQSNRYLSETEILELIKNCNQLKSITTSIHNYQMVNKFANLLAIHPTLTNLNVFSGGTRGANVTPLLQKWPEVNLETLSIRINSKLMEQYFMTDSSKCTLKTLILQNIYQYHGALDQFLSTNHSLTSLDIEFRFNTIAGYFENFSMMLSNHPSLTYLSVCPEQKAIDILKHLDKSMSLQFIDIKVSRLSNKKQALINLPFQLVPELSKEPYNIMFFRNGIHYDPVPTSTIITDYLKKLMNSLNKYYSE
ncbi:hypothetical protein DLAC_01186 [Tieghemostelium lacteum]|uniref:Uncharacterized protein n=1 Tax=Tieghemostelium lacteum TaxID=361077 RepID=A0A152A827_TIELA|nr:hypothetical protein DLAC_01186 [Tieghemostelium lacteum]|eukprot:KYR02354.1 hypothetical protein DLAC_01186 [Tieghemostelium lacteum]